VGVDPEIALWMTPREMYAAAEGYGRHQRLQAVMHPMSDVDERQARQIIEGRTSTLSPEEQQRKLDELKDRIHS